MAPLYTDIFRVPPQFQSVDEVAWWARHLRSMEGPLPPPFDGGAASAAAIEDVSSLSDPSADE
eukprot:660314-Karenia_brevis.AAC.1